MRKNLYTCIRIDNTSWYSISTVSGALADGFDQAMTYTPCLSAQKIMQDIYSASMSAAKEYDTHLQVSHDAAPHRTAWTSRKCAYVKSGSHRVCFASDPSCLCYTIAFHGRRPVWHFWPGCATFVCYDRVIPQRCFASCCRPVPTSPGS